MNVGLKTNVCLNVPELVQNWPYAEAWVDSGPDRHVTVSQITDNSNVCTTASLWEQQRNHQSSVLMWMEFTIHISSQVTAMQKASSCHDISMKKRYSSDFPWESSSSRNLFFLNCHRKSMCQVAMVTMFGCMPRKIAFKPGFKSVFKPFILFELW